MFTTMIGRVPRDCHYLPVASVLLDGTVIQEGRLSGHQRPGKESMPR